MNSQISTHFTVEIEQEGDGRWIAEIPELPDILVYGETQEMVIASVQMLALRAIADKVEHKEMDSESISTFCL